MTHKTSVGKFTWHTVHSFIGGACVLLCITSGSLNHNTILPSLQKGKLRISVSAKDICLDIARGKTGTTKGILRLKWRRDKVTLKMVRRARQIIFYIAPTPCFSDAADAQGESK